jgi:curli biogenesis system outer membrane secretion channel CsgG
MFKSRSGWKTNRRRDLFLSLAGLLIIGIGSVAVRSETVPQTQIPIAVFAFELDDVTPASSLLRQTTSSVAALQKVTDAARRALVRSGRYRVIIPTTGPLTSKQPYRLQDCNGCEAPMALQLGAKLSMIGVVHRATQTDYYIAIAIRDAQTGKLVNEQSANFAGGEEGWPSGVRMLLDHQVLYPGQPERLSSSDESTESK